MRQISARAFGPIIALLALVLIAASCVGYATAMPFDSMLLVPTVPAATSSMGGSEPTATLRPAGQPVTATVEMDTAVTPVASSSGTMTATVAPVSAGQPVSSTTVLYEDDFKDPNSGWPDELLFQDYYVGYHEPDFYHVEVHVPNDIAIVTVPERTFADFEVETGVFVSKANTSPNGDFRYGLVIRRSGNRYYAFTISPRTQTWYVLKSSPGNMTVLGQGTQTSIRGLEAHDILRVNARGPVMTFYINDQMVNEVSDSDYTSGGIGFYVETFDSPKAHGHFDYIVVR